MQMHHCIAHAKSDMSQDITRKQGHPSLPHGMSPSVTSSETTSGSLGL